MTATVVCFASAKGGSGKTVTCASLAQVIGALSRRVLIVDIDAATNGLTLLYLSKVIATKREYESQGKIPRGIFETPDAASSTPIRLNELIDIIPATYVMGQTEARDPSKLKAALTDVVLAARGAYDFIFLDAQAGSDLYAEAAIQAADQTVLVTEVDPISAEGVLRLRDIFRTELTFERHWILFNKVLPELAQNKDADIWTPVRRELSAIPWDRDVVRAFAHRQLAVDLEVGNAYTLAVIQIASELFEERLGAAVADWRSSRAGRLKDPLRVQLAKLESELADLDIAIARTQEEFHRIERGTLVGYLGTGASVVLAVVSGVTAAFGNVLVGVLILLVAVAVFLASIALSAGGASIGRALRAIRHPSDLSESLEDLFSGMTRPTERVAILAGQRRTLERRQQQVLEERGKYLAMLQRPLEDLVRERIAGGDGPLTGPADPPASS